MAVSHAILSLISTIFLAGSLVLLFFVILSGLNSTTPLGQTYFLSADTSGITGAKAVSQWTYFYICSPGNVDCTPASAAQPFGHAWAGSPTGAPDALVGPHGGDTTSTYYFYMWRFGWVLYLIALFFMVLAFFASAFACLGRLGSALVGTAAATGLFFLTIAVALMTTTFVKARNEFQAAGKAASIGTYAFGFSWGAWAALLISVVLFFLGTRSRRGESTGGGRGWGRRSRSTRSRKSADLSGSRRVRDDYS